MSQRLPPNTGESQELYQGRKLKAIAARWDAKAATWDENLSSPGCHLNEDEGYSRFLLQTIEVIKARRRFCAQHGVIDAGCGTGLVLAAVAASFAWGVGVDVSPEMIRMAETKHLKQCTFVVGDCFQLPSLCPKAGAVFSRGVLLSHYGPKEGLALLQAARSTLKPRGFLLFDFLNASGRSVSKHVAENKSYYRGPEVCALARDAGFTTALVLGETERRVQLLLAQVP